MVTLINKIRFELRFDIKWYLKDFVVLTFLLLFSCKITTFVFEMLITEKFNKKLSFKKKY